MNTVRSAAPARPTANSGGRFSFKLSDEFLRQVDLVAWVLWGVAQTFLPFQASAIRYLLSVYFVGTMAMRYRRFAGLMARCWPMFLLPLLAFISSLWAPSAGEAIRKSMMLTFTAFVGIYVARQLTARQIIYAAFGINFFAALLSAVSLDYEGGGATGVFNQKNVLALSMFFLISSGIVLAFDRVAHWIFRVAAVAIMPLAVWLMIKAESATILILSIPMCAALVVQVVFWGPMQRIRHMRSLMALVALFLLAAVVLILFGLIQFDAVTALLNSVGKDTTLTGRTIMWDQANRIMAENPWTGLGANGFWRPEVGEANAILRVFHFTTYTPFSFHNSYLENGVQFGYPGMIATYFLGAWCFYRAFMTWLMRQDLHNAYFLFLAIMILARSFTEIDLATELGWTFILILICAARENPRPQRQAVYMAPVDANPAHPGESPTQTPPDYRR